MEARKFELKDAGLSERQLEEHIKLYEGYCKKIDEIKKKIIDSEKEGNATFSEIRELKIEEGFCINAIKLHELYFENIHAKKDVVREIVKEIEEDFGSYEYWRKEFSACAMSARGWVMLAYDWKDDKLHNYIMDVHNQGAVIDVVPLIVLDMYEHSYFIDFGTNKKDYIEWFLAHINWKIAEERTERF
jgi:superoxide dismutase, Fe-Mn family